MGEGRVLCLILCASAEPVLLRLRAAFPALLSPMKGGGRETKNAGQQIEGRGTIKCKDMRGMNVKEEERVVQSRRGSRERDTTLSAHTESPCSVAYPQLHKITLDTNCLFRISQLKRRKPLSGPTVPTTIAKYLYNSNGHIHVVQTSEER